MFHIMKKFYFFLFLIISYTSALAEKTYHASKDGFCYYEVSEFGKGTGILSTTGQVLIPQSLKTVHLWYVEDTGMFKTFGEGGFGVITKNGKWVIPNCKYYVATPKITGNKKWIKVGTKDGKYGACDEYGNEIVPLSYADVKYFTKHQSFGTKKTKSQEKFTLYKENKDGSSRNYVDNSNSKSKGSSSSKISKEPTTKRVTNWDGSYSDITNNPDGTTTTITYSTCTSCYGSKYCSICGGVGGKYVGFGSYQNYYICSGCGGGGACKYCGGTGTKVLISNYNPVSGLMTSQDPYTGKTYTSVAGYSDSNNKSSSSSANKSSYCSSCKGTGMDLVAYDIGFAPSGVGGYTNSSGSQCPYCNQYNAHQHVYCPVCNTDKW